MFRVCEFKSIGLYMKHAAAILYLGNRFSISLKTKQKQKQNKKNKKQKIVSDNCRFSISKRQQLYIRFIPLVRVKSGKTSS